MRRYVVLLTMLVLLTCLRAWGQNDAVKEEIILVDYFGYNIPVICKIPVVSRKAISFEELVEIDTEEIKDCYRALEEISTKYQFVNHNYGQALLFWKFAEALPNDKVYKNGWVSFSEVVLNKDQKNENGNYKIYLGRNDKIALIYSLLARAGYGVKVLQDDNKNYYLALRVNANIYGTYLIDNPGFYRWEPGYNFGNIPSNLMPSGYLILSNNGKPITFNHLGAIPWNQTARGDKVDFKSPKGCPSSWNFSINRLPKYEEFLQFWPHDAGSHRIVQACLAKHIFAPFDLEGKFNPEKNPELKEMRSDQLGNCLFKWVRLNIPYGKGQKYVRNPVITLVKDQTGDCDELSLALIGVLSSAGFPADHIKMVHWPTHLSLGGGAYGRISIR